MTTRRTRILATTGAIAATGLLGASLVVGSLIAHAPRAMAAPHGDQGRFPISVEEMDARRAEIFANADSNGDGLISAEEFAAAEMPERRRGKRGHKGGYRGGDNAGEMTPSAEMLERRSEMMAVMEENLFHALDADSDGVISRAEFSQEAMNEARKATMKARVFERADQDGDGYLSPDEFPPRRLAQMDANGDGEVTRDELRHGRQGWGSASS